MNRILTWAEFRTELKNELGIQATSTQDDALLLSLANESLVQMAQSGKDLREFRVDVTVPVLNVGLAQFDQVTFSEIEQVYYHVHDAGDIFQYRYDLTEYSGVVGLAHPSYPQGPNSYSVTMELVIADNPVTNINLYPKTATITLHKIQAIGCGFLLIVDDTTRMYYFALYPWLKAAIMERWFIKRNDDPQKLQAVATLVSRTGSLAASGTVDKGDTVTTQK